MMDLLRCQFIRDLVGGSNGLLGNKNKSEAMSIDKITSREARL